MVREKVQRRYEVQVVYYDKKHWRLLKEKREEALRILKALNSMGIHAIVHGSIARGDVHQGSDIDIFIPYPLPSYMLEIALERASLKPVYKLVIQATPRSTPKAYIVLDIEEKRVVSFPLAKLSKTEYEFYYFGGALDIKGLQEGRRVPGVDKRLMLIEPLPEGHRESSVIGREAMAARAIGISIETVLERVAVLSRRDEHGRTGVFVKEELDTTASIEEAVKHIARRNPHFRRILLERGSPFL